MLLRAKKSRRRAPGALSKTLLAIAIVLISGTPAGADSKASRLAALIAKTNPKEPKPSEFAAAIIREAKRHGLPVAHLAAVAYTESRFRRKARGKAGEIGAWQVLLHEHSIGDYWDWLRSHPAGFPLATKWGAMPWRAMGKRRAVVLESIAEGAYIAAAAIKAHAVMCERMGHRIGKGYCRQTPSGTRCIRRHAQVVDRLGHYHSGASWPRAFYIRSLRRWSRRIARRLKGEKR